MSSIGKDNTFYCTYSVVITLIFLNVSIGIVEILFPLKSLCKNKIIFKGNDLNEMISFFISYNFEIVFIPDLDKAEISEIWLSHNSLKR